MPRTFPCERCQTPLRASHACALVMCPHCHFSSFAPIHWEATDSRPMEPPAAAEAPRMTIRCPGCRQRMRVRQSHAHEHGTCPRCRTRFVVPAPDAADDAVPAEALVAADGRTTDSRTTDGGPPRKQPARSGWRRFF